MKKLSLFFYLFIVYIIPAIGQITNPNYINYELYADEWGQDGDNDVVTNDDNMVRIGVTTDGATGGTITWHYTGSCNSPYGYVRRWSADAPSTNTHATAIYSAVNRTSNNQLSYTIQSWETDNGFNCYPVSGDDQRWGPTTYTVTYRNATKTPNQWWGVHGTNGLSDWSANTKGRVKLKTVWRYALGDSCNTPLSFGTLASGVTKTHFNSNKTTPTGARAEMGYTNTRDNNSADVYYSFSISQPSTVVISTVHDNTNYDTYLRLLSSDCGTQIAYNDDFSGSGTKSQITKDLCAGSYKILVEGFSTNTGNFNLSVTATTISTNGGTIATTTPSSICPGTTLLPFTNISAGSGLGTIAYQWERSTTSSTSGFSSISGETASTYNPSNVAPTQTTWFRRKATDECGRVLYSNTIQITVNTLSTPPTTITGTTTICNGGSTILTANGATLGTGASIKWYSASCGGTAIGTGNSITVSPTANTNYYARAEGTCNTTTCASTTVTVNTLSTPPTTITGTTTICNGGSTILTANGATLGTGASIKWYSASCGGTVVGTGTSITVSPTTNTTYYARVEGTCNTTTCASTTVNINTSSIAPSGIIGTNTICNGESTILTADGMSLGTGATIQWFAGSCGSTVIGTGNSITVTPTTNTTYFARISGTCNTTNCVSTTVTVNTLSTPPTTITGNSTICSGETTTLTATDMTIGTGAGVQWYIGSCGGAILGAGNSITVAPTTTTTYYARVSGACNTTTCASVTVNVNTTSSHLTIHPVPSIHCPNTNITLSATAILGTGGNIKWYTAPNGGGTLVGTGNNVIVAPMSTTTYYARLEDLCGNSADVSTTLNIRQFVYAANNTSATEYCTDNDGWNHFYRGNEIILSVKGNVSNMTNPTATIRTQTNHYQDRPSGGNPINCTTGWTPGEERFEMGRNWNIYHSGTLNGTYQVRFYFPLTQKTTTQTAANNFAATYPDCDYGYKYGDWHWFKNTAGNYVAPIFEDILLSGTESNINGIHYVELQNLTSFSGGSGAVILVPDNTLPIELLFFNGIYENGKSFLNWATSAEWNNSHFEIQRSPTGFDNDFELIGTIASLGDSHDTQSYDFTDYHPLAGINYYRLRQIDFDGTFSYSPIIALEAPKTNTQPLFFPNPTSGNVTYQFISDLQEKVEITVLNSLGQIMSTYTYNAEIGNNQMTINLESYASGMYIINAQHTLSGAIVTESIIKATP